MRLKKNYYKCASLCKILYNTTIEHKFFEVHIKVEKKASVSVLCST